MGVEKRREGEDGRFLWSKGRGKEGESQVGLVESGCCFLLGSKWVTS